MACEHISNFLIVNCQYILNIFGLCFDLGGVILLVYGVLDNLDGLKEDKTKPLVPQLNAWTKKYTNTPQVKRWAVRLIITGFALQALGNIVAFKF